jgi:uncharacterized lipoprotein
MAGMLACALSACGGGTMTCDKPQRYQSSHEGQRIVVPEGLDELETSSELAIPDASPREPRPEGSPCLELPPVYRSQST